MRKSLLTYLCCPECRADLGLEGVVKAEGEIVEGELVCANGHVFPIVNGIPNLVIGMDTRVERTGRQFAYEFLEVGDVADLDRKLHQDITLFFAKTGIDSNLYRLPGLDFRRLQDYRALGYEPDYGFLAGKVVVDAGAADGRFARLVAPHVDELLLLDLGEHLHRAKERFGAMDNVHFVQCNLLHLPLRDSVADFVFSIGVVHHTPSPGTAVRELARALRPGGELALWVYPPAYWGNPVKKWISQRIRSVLLRWDLPEQVDFIRRWLMPLGRLQHAVARWTPLKYLLAPLFVVNIPRHEDRHEMEATVIDYYLPEHIFTYDDEGLRQLVEGADLTYQKLPFPSSARGRRDAGG